VVEVTFYNHLIDAFCEQDTVLKRICAYVAKDEKSEYRSYLDFKGGIDPAPFIYLSIYLSLSLSLSLSLCIYI